MTHNKLHVFHNTDKENFKETRDLSNIANFITPFRAVLAGPPSCGKTCLVKNLIINQKPYFNRIIIYHLDPMTTEYNDIDGELVQELPSKDEIDRDIKTLLICEDIPYRDLTKKERVNLDSYLRYVSSHKGCSIIMTCQDITTGVPPAFRRLTNIVCLYKSIDMNPIFCICRFMGINKNLVTAIFDKLIQSKYDFLTIDKSGSGPELRKNLFEPIIFE